MVLRHIIFAIIFGIICTAVSLGFGFSILEAFLVYVVSGACGIVLSALVSYR